MRKHSHSAFILAAALVYLLPGVPALAATTVWVSNAGVDSGLCGPLGVPCRSFQQAHNNVDAGGDIGVLTPGDYGQTFISKSVHITNDALGEASILRPAADGAITINAGAGDIVTLRGLVLDGQGFGATRGIQLAGATAVHVQNCVIRNFVFGILMFTVNNTKLFVSDTLVYNNGTVAETGGIFIQPTAGGSANVVLDRVRLENNVVGLFVAGSFTTGDGAHVVLRDSVVSGNAADGILAATTAGAAPAFIVVERTSSVNNAGTGIRADGPGATILLHGNAVARNAVGISAVNMGQLISYGTNKVNNNDGPDGTPTSSYLPR